MNHQVRDERPLESWKEIAVYLQRDAKTARNWEKEEGLPVHRHSHKSRSSVYAYPSEIDAWRAGRRVVADPARVRPWWRPLAFGATALLCLMMVGNGIRPQVAAAQQGAGKAARQVWSAGVLENLNAVSQDGRFVAYTNWNTGDLWVRNLTTGMNRRLTHYGGPDEGTKQYWQYVEGATISPDNTQIAYSWSIDKEIRNDLRIIPIAGGELRIVWSAKNAQGYIFPFNWTPDGKQLLVAYNPPDRTTQIAFLSVADGKIRPLKSFAWQRGINASLSPDGRWVAYSAPPNEQTQANDIYLPAADGSRETKLVEHPANDAQPVWSPDGKRVLFTSDRTGNPSLWSVPVNDSKPGAAEMVRADIGEYPRTLLWITSDATLYYGVRGLGKPNVYVAELGNDGKLSKPPALALENFVNSNSQSVVSPNGESLALRRVGAGLVIRTLATGEERVVKLQAPVGEGFGGFQWFPDNRSMVVPFRNPQSPGVEFYRADLDSGRVQLLHRSAKGTTHWRLSPDGTFIFFSEQNSGETVPKISTRLVRYDIEARRETELKKGEWFMGVGVSPDSKQLVYLTNVEGSGTCYLSVMPAEGGESREVYRAPNWGGYSRSVTLAWTPDQRYIYFVTENRAESTAWRVSSSGGPAEKLVSMQARLAISPHPDGQRLYVSAVETAPDELWALENFLPVKKEK